MKGKLIVFSAPSGSGKTSIVKQLLSNSEFNFEFSVSATSRPKRSNEQDGKDYYFLSAEEFKKKIKNDEFVEWEEVYADRFYGTLKTEVKRIREKGNHVIFDIDVAGGLNIKKLYKENCLTFFIMPPSIIELEKRLRLRGTENEAELKKRLEKAEFEMGFSDKFDTIVINDVLETAVLNVKNILTNFIQAK